MPAVDLGLAYGQTRFANWPLRQPLVTAHYRQALQRIIPSFRIIVHNCLRLNLLSEITSPHTCKLLVRKERISDLFRSRSQTRRDISGLLFKMLGT